MAGSYRHVAGADNSFRGIELIDNLGDASEAIEEMYAMIEWFAQQANPNSPRRAIHEAWLEGYARPNLPPENVANERLCGFDAFWEEDY